MICRKKQAQNIMKGGSESKSKQNAKEYIDKMSMKGSTKYNPFNYIRELKDIDTIAYILALANKLLNADHEEFFVSIGNLWLKASIGYI